MYGQGWIEIGQLCLAFLLSGLIGLERQLRGKRAGLRTQTIVGTTAALILLISKFGFQDVLVPGQVVLDPSRVAAQIVTGIGFLGAGLILTRRGNVHGLTTAASVWEAAAIGMAAASGLWLLAIAVTGLHFVAVIGLTALRSKLPVAHSTSAVVQITYNDGLGALREALEVVTNSRWDLHGLSERPNSRDGQVTVSLDLRGSSTIESLVNPLSRLDGIRSVRVLSEEEIE